MGSSLPTYRFRKDGARRRRGGKTRLIDVYCANCNALLLVYQKDMPKGALKRCYLDRIFYPPEYAGLGKSCLDVNGMPALECKGCGHLAGFPMRYTKHGEDRLAYSMVPGSFIKKSSTHGIGKD